MSSLTSSTIIAFVFGVIAVALPFSGQAPQPWHQHSLVGMEVGPTGAQFGHSDITDKRYAAHFDGREIVRRYVLSPTTRCRSLRLA